MKKIWTIIFLVFAFSFVRAQDAEFSQFYSNPVYLNPALAGTADACRFNLNFRSKFPAYNAFKTYAVAYDQSLYKGWNQTPFGGLGANVLVNTADGIINTYQINATYAHHFKIKDKFYLNMGLTAGTILKQLNPTNIILPDGSIGGGAEGLSKSTVAIPDFSFGVYATYDGKYYGGVSMHHLQGLADYYSDSISYTTSLSLYVPYKISVHGGVELPFGYGNKAISPNILWNYQKGFNQINIGLYTKLERITLGVWYKNNLRVKLPDAIDPNTHVLTILMGLNFDNLNIGYSYDSCLSGLGLDAKGAHEISVSYLFNVYSTGKKRVIGAIKSPTF